METIMYLSLNPCSFNVVTFLHLQVNDDTDLSHSFD